MCLHIPKPGLNLLLNLNLKDYGVKQQKKSYKNDQNKCFCYCFLPVDENILYIWTMKLEEDAKVKGMYYILKSRKYFWLSLVAHTGVSHVI